MKSNNVEKDRFIYRYLEWDTEYFEKKCARIDLLDEITSIDKERISRYIKSNEFVVLNNSKEIPKNNEYIGTELKAFITDINVQLKKNRIIKDNSHDYRYISISNNKEFDNDIIILAKDSFENSRFLNDSNISKDKAEGVYTNWVNNSFNKENKYFITFSNERRIIGFILFSINNLNELVIELICVSKEFKGNGIGKSLMKALDNFAIKNGNEVINVGTQIENINALNFYVICGYRIDDIRYIYHWWNV